MSSQLRSESPKKDFQSYDLGLPRPAVPRSTTFEGPTQLHRDASPIGAQRMTRVPSDNIAIKSQRSQLRPLNRANSENEGPIDPSDESNFYSSPDRSYVERSVSPATSYGSAPSRSTSYTMLEGASNVKKPPPPPPPSRAKKPPPPPPPMKRSGLSTTAVSYA